MTHSSHLLCLMEGMYVERNDIIQTDFDDSTSSAPRHLETMLQTLKLLIS